MSTNNLNPITEEQYIKSLYDSITEKLLSVYNVFKGFFGESYVDIQNCPSFKEFKYILKGTPIYIYIRTFQLNKFIKCDDSYKYTNENLYYFINNNLIDISNCEILNILVISLRNFLFSNSFIIVYFPKVKVENEINKSVDITKLWAKIKVTPFGTLKEGFSLNRSEYNISQFICNYMHSHVKNIPKANFKNFQQCCLGTGPIRYTTNTLFYNYDLQIWELFCLELSKYVRTESLSGGPYHYLEDITNKEKNIWRPITIKIQSLYNHLATLEIDFKDFIKYFINRRLLKFNYSNNSYSIGMSNAEYCLLISNEFIKWCNAKYISSNNINFKNYYTKNYLLKHSILKECFIKDNKIFYLNTSNINSSITTSTYKNIKVLTFKKKDIKLNIINDNMKRDNYYLILDTDISLYILYKILEVLNFSYGNKESFNKSNSVDTSIEFL